LRRERFGEPIGLQSEAKQVWLIDCYFVLPVATGALLDPSVGVDRVSSGAAMHGAVKGYRQDIDGLRAVAILLVLLYHFDLGVSGGFVGVDVFFVISGYLITGIIHRQSTANGFSYLDFYERRARRILPALIVVLAACTVAATVMLLPSDLERYGVSLAAALVFISNFFFWSQGSYFGQASDLAPLLHTWSLSVEEQFYLAMPPLYLLLRRLAPNWIPHAFALVTLITLAAASYLVLYRAHVVFFWTPFRVWELAIGGWLAVAKLPDIAAPPARCVVAALGIGMILAAGVLLDSNTVYPGHAALLPCLGASLVIWAGTKSNAVSTALLANRPMVFIGLISYSLYLWHWPMMAFARHYHVGDTVPARVRVPLAFLSVLMAYLSWRLVETPFRNREMGTRRKLVAWSAASGTAAVTLAALLHLSQGLPLRFTERVVALDAERTRVPYREECMNLRGPIEISSACRLGAAGNPTVLVWGDSYAHAMMPAFQSALGELGVSGVFLGRSGCPPVPTSTMSRFGRENWKCSIFNSDVLTALSEDCHIDTVVIVAAWNHYVDPETGYAISPNAGELGDPLTISLAHLERTLARNPKIQRIVIVGQVPSYPWGIPYRMAVAAMRSEVMPVIPYSTHAKASEKPRAAFKALDGRLVTRVINQEAWFCNDAVCNYADSSGRPYYFDHGHINQRGADFVAPSLTKELRAILGTSAGTETSSPFVPTTTRR
jgi:peptidoglycan/LPS O-acetylase OafA/YrhL